MKKIKNYILLLPIIIIGGLLIYATSESNENTTYFDIPTEMDFASEKVPLNGYEIQERVDRELLINTHLHSSTILILKRANKIFPIIEPILLKYQVPDDFKYLSVIESALVNAVSSAGARGIWQFMPETAKEKGMEVSESVDERYHLEKSTEAACKYLVAAKEKFGSWTLAAASYNGGMAGITKQIEFQQETNYYDLLLNDETSRYVFRILALKTIMKNPEKYGFNLDPKLLYNNIKTRQIQIDSSVSNLAIFAKSQGINYKILKYHNPWLRDKKLDNPSRKLYCIQIPTN